MSIREFVGVHTSERQPGVGTVLISREPVNALTRQSYRELESAVAEVNGRGDIRAVILFGGHDIFSAGDDMPELLGLDHDGAEAADHARRRCIEAVAAIAKPCVAAITGYALGSGLSLALAADWRLCGDNAKLGATEVLHGRAPGGCARLLAAVGPSRAKELTFSGRFVGAEEALTLGLVDELVSPDDVYDAALGWAARFSDAPPAALAAAKALINAGLPADPER